jgi:very-short-patch-repair endonuclease
MWCPFLAADAALWADDPEPDQPVTYENEHPRVEEFDDRPAQLVGEPIGNILADLVEINTDVASIEELTLIPADKLHDMINRCLEQAELGVTYDNKVSILQKLRPHLGEVFGRCESPIEQLMVFALLNRFAVDWFNSEWVSLEDGIGFGSVGGRLCQQWIVENYRVDFLLVTPSGRRIVIECDGHDYHERTPVQAQRDRSRDRWFQMRGFMVLRFTGSEIHRNSAQCAREISEALCRGA